VRDPERALDPADWPSHLAFVRRLARSLLADPSEADDVAQDAWLTWSRSPPREAGALRRWLASVARNLVLMRDRSSIRREGRERGGAIPESQPSAAHLVEQMDLHRRVVELVLALDEPFRTVVMLRFYEQRSLEEIAKQLDVPLETVKSRQRRALARLRTELLGDEASTERRAALAVLTGAGGGVAMTIGAKGAAAAAVVAGLLAWSAWRWNSDEHRLTVTTRSGAATPIAAAAEPAPSVERSALGESGPPSTPATPVEPPTTPPVPVYECRGDVVDRNERPLAGIRVELFEGERRSGAIARRVASAVSDEQGAFVFAVAATRAAGFAEVVAREGAACTGIMFDPRNASPLHLVLGATKSIVGRVVDASGEPIEGAALLARYWHASETSGFYVPDPLERELTVLSDADGSFEMRGMPCGWSIGLDVRRDGFASRLLPVVLDESVDSQRLELTLLPEAVIEGTVTTEDGARARGIRVGAQRLESDADRSNTWGASSTDGDGRFTIRQLAAGRWNVLVDLDATQSRDWCALPIESVELTESQPRAHVDLRLQHGGEVAIHVAEATTGAPIADQWVGIESTARPRSGAAINAVFSDDEGNARIRLPAGPVHCYIADPSERWSSRNVEIRSSRFELLAGQTAELTVTLDRGITLRGIVVDPRGKPVANVRVWCSAPSSDANPLVATSRSDGSFAIDRVPRGGSWTLRAATELFAMHDPQPIDEVATASGTVKLWLEERPANKIHGRAVDSAGAPIAGVTVQISEQRDDVPVEGAADPLGQVKSRKDGTFELRGLWPDLDYRLSATHFAQEEGKWLVFTAERTTATVRDGETRDLGDLTMELQRGR
jgi:RNA polymerase sigma-70 factor (ECF subfamily)